MKKIVLVLALAIACSALGSAHAQTVAAAVPVMPAPMRFLVGMGLSAGGDQLATAKYTDGSSVNLHAGGLVYFTAGVDFRIAPQWSLQSTINYHVDQANAKNGDIKFQRFPVELILYYQPNPAWRVGGGARYASSAKLKSSGVASGLDAEFDSKTAAVVEAEWFTAPNVGFKLRYVNEKYKERGYGDIDGSHVGVSANFYF